MATILEPETSEVVPKKGVAPIKQEFLLPPTNDRSINWSHVVGDESKDKQDGGEKRRIDDRDNPDKKFKLRGQNKNKLRYKLGVKAVWSKRDKSKNCDHEQDEKKEKRNIDNASRLCLKYMESDGNCPYTGTCNYSHDLFSVYNASKEQFFDESKSCYIYSTYGRCSFGAACKFCVSHTYTNLDKKILFNLIDHRKWSLNHGRQAFKARYCNRIDTDLQKALRKKQYDFKIINDVMQALYQADLGEEKVNETEKNDSDQIEEKRIGALVIDNFPYARDSKRKTVDFKNKLYLAPLTTVGNLAFRRLCKKFSCDITCAEMSLCSAIANGNPSEWSHFKRHESEDVFGIQITGHHPEQTTKVVKILNDNCELDFIDINCGCPTEWIYQSGAGAGLMSRPSKLRKIIAGACMVSKVPITVKMRTGCSEEKNTAHCLINSIVRPFGNKYIGAVTVHGRSRNQRYLRNADWDYVQECAKFSGDIPVLGSGDCISWQDYYNKLDNYDGLSGVMIARGALLKPWIFTEIKERRTWDISSKERLDIIGDFVNFALDHWGSDATGVENSRRFLLEWLSFASRYIPVGLLEVLPQKINDRPPAYKGRDELETLLSSQSCSDWIKISEMFLGKVPDNFNFIPKHKANAYEAIVEG